MQVNSTPPQVDANRQFIVTLPLGAWQSVLNLLGKGPWELADPLIQVIKSQVEQQIQQAGPSLPGMHPQEPERVN